MVMATAAPSSMPGQRSLLSRLTPSAPVNAVLTTKRRAPERVDERPAKRRHSDNKFDSHLAPWLETQSISNTGTPEERLHDELVQFLEYISPSEQELEARKALIVHTEKLIKARWQDAQVRVFGSSATGLGLTGGDIDLVVSFDATGTLPDSEKKGRLATIGKIVRNSGMTYWVNRIFSARVPIITFETTEELGEVEFDISIRNSEDAGLRAIPLVEQYLADIPALRPLILSVKAYLSLHDLNDASQGTLSSYAITLLCISFLQRNPTGRSQEQLKDPFATKSLGLLLTDFFRYYGYDFPYETHYISVTERGVLPKSSKSWEVKRNSPAVLIVQCILNPDSNITRVCTKIAWVIDAFKEAYHTLSSVSVKKPGANCSLLSQIYDVSEEDDAKRHSLDDSVRSGAFSRAIASCSTDVDKRVSAEVSSRVIGGGVLLANRNDQRRGNPIGRNNRPNLLMRLGPGPMQTSGNGFAFDRPFNDINGSLPRGGQQMPPHWREEQPIPCFPNAPFTFQMQSWRSQGLPTNHPSQVSPQTVPQSLQQRMSHSPHFFSYRNINNHATNYDGRVNYAGWSYSNRR